MRIRSVFLSTFVLFTKCWTKKKVIRYGMASKRYKKRRLQIPTNLRLCQREVASRHGLRHPLHPQNRSRRCFPIVCENSRVMRMSWTEKKKSRERKKKRGRKKGVSRLWVIEETRCCLLSRFCRPRSVVPANLTMRKLIQYPPIQAPRRRAANVLFELCFYSRAVHLHIWLAYCMNYMLS